jgi:hypothetical protein
MDINTSSIDQIYQEFRKDFGSRGYTGPTGETGETGSTGPTGQPGFTEEQIRVAKVFGHNPEDVYKFDGSNGFSELIFDAEECSAIEKVMKEDDDGNSPYGWLRNIPGFHEWYAKARKIHDKTWTANNEVLSRHDANLVAFDKSVEVSGEQLKSIQERMPRSRSKVQNGAADEYYDPDGNLIKKKSWWKFW